MSNYPPNNPPNPPGYPPPNYPPPNYQTQGFGQPPPPKKSKTWMYVLFGCGGLMLIGVIVVVIVVFMAANKAKEMAGEFERNPEFAGAKLAVQMNPDVDLVSSDESKGTLTIRDKKTGKTVTINFKNVGKDGKVTLTADDGEEATISASGSGSSGSVEIKSNNGSVVLGSGAAVDLPSWMPNYPGSDPQGVFSAKSSDGDVTSYHFITSDSPSQVMSFYQDKLEGEGLKVTSTTTALAGGTGGGMVTAESSNRGRLVAVVITPSASGTQVNVQVTSK